MEGTEASLAEPEVLASQVHKSPLNILFWGVSPFCTGAYASQGRQIACLFKDFGHKVTYLCYAGFQGELDWDGIYLVGVADSGLSILPYLSKGKELILAFFDVWTLPLLTDPGLLTIYQPIDHSPVSYRLRMFLSKARDAISMTRWQQAELGKLGIKSAYIPHWINEEVFKPMEKMECRKRLGFPIDAFIIGICAGNVGQRKNFEGMIDAFAEAHARHPDMVLALHTYPIRDFSHEDAIDIITLLNFHGLQEKKDYFLCNPFRYLLGYPAEEMAMWYNALDVHMLCSLGEGFGIPIVEAALCGKPSIVTDFAAAPEVDGPTAIKVPATSLVFFPLNKSLVRRPTVEDIVEGIETAYFEGVDLKVRGEKAREHALANYTAKAVEPMWADYLTHLSCPDNP